MSTTSKRLRTLVATGTIATTVALVLAGCGARAGDDTSGGKSAAPSCVDTSGDTIKLGFLNSLTGGMAISEKTVSNVLHMATDEINAGGGILGKKIKYIQEDGATDWPTFAEKTEKLLTQDWVGAVFGGWTSSSRKADAAGRRGRTTACSSTRCSTRALRLRRTSTTPVRPPTSRSSRRWTSSPSKGVKRLFLAGSDYVFPRTANKIIKLYAAKLGIEIVGEEYVPLDKDDWTTQVAKIVAAKPDFIFNTINGSSNVGFIKAYYDAGLTAATTPIISVSIAEEEAPAMGDEVTGHYAVLELLPVAQDRHQPKVHRELEGLPEQQRRHLRPDGGRLHLAVPVQGPRRDGRLVRRRRGERRSEEEHHHVRRTGGHRHARRREPPHLKAGPHRPDQRQQPVRHRLGLRQVHRARPVPQRLRLVPGEHPRPARESRGLIAPPPTRTRGCVSPAAGNPAYPDPHSASLRAEPASTSAKLASRTSGKPLTARPRTESESTWTLWSRRC